MSIVTLDQFKEHLNNLNESGNFSFGFNWFDYVKTRLNEEIIEKHKQNLERLYSSINIDIQGKSVLDIGCGSGLSSLSFAKLGASKLTSFDIDEYSVQATALTKQKFFFNEIDWEIKKASILEQTEIQQHDFVYSWGVLHHTGDMWKAIKNAAAYVKSGGYFHIALYRSGPSFPRHLAEKQKFASLDRDDKIKMLYEYMLRNHGRNILSKDTDERGMNIFHDALDWLGGLPYEVCDPKQLVSFLPDFSSVYFKDWNEGGNFIMILKKN